MQLCWTLFTTVTVLLFVFRLFNLKKNKLIKFTFGFNDISRNQLDGGDKETMNMTTSVRSFTCWLSDMLLLIDSIHKTAIFILKSTEGTG